MLCENCESNPVTEKFEEWCNECITTYNEAAQAEYEEAITDGEAWALYDDPELWNAKYRSDEDGLY